MAKLGDLITTCNGRLTLTSGTPVTTSDVTAATTLYYTPYKGDNIALYNGEEWLFYEFSELSLSLSGYTADTNYDIWMYDNSGVLTLDSTAWSDATTRATALATQNGVYTKTGDTLRRYLGTIRITDTTGQCEHSSDCIFVWNYYNQVTSRLRIVDSNAHTYGTATWRPWNNDSSLIGKYVIGVNEGRFVVANYGFTTSNAIVCFGYDSLSSPYTAYSYIRNLNTSATGQGVTSQLATELGYHYCSLLEYGAGGSAWFSVGRITVWINC